MLLKEENFLLNGEFFVPKHLWQEIVESHTVEEISKFIQNLILKHDIPFPFEKYSQLELKNEFAKLKNEDVYSGLIFEKWLNLRVQIKSNFTYKDKHIFIKRSLIGRSCSNAFMQYERVKAKYLDKGLSPFDAWDMSDAKAQTLNIPARNYKFKFNFAIKHCDELNSSNLRASIRMNIGIPSQFSTMVAKTIYTITQAKNVLDFSAGWGDRLIGALTTDTLISYTGIDPNTALHPRYAGINNFYKHNKKTTFICSPAENVDLTSNQFDLIFTSPPYFDREIYSDEDTQSTSKYKTIDDWLEHFLLKVITRSYTWLKEDSRLMLNISDYYTGKTYIQKMIEFAQSIGFIYEGVIGYELQARPGGDLDGKGSIRSVIQDDFENNAFLCEPIFIFAKGNPQDLILSNPNSLF
jgi:hypothetical protein